METEKNKSEISIADMVEALKKFFSTPHNQYGELYTVDHLLNMAKIAYGELIQDKITPDEKRLESYEVFGGSLVEPRTDGKKEELIWQVVKNVGMTPQD